MEAKSKTFTLRLLDPKKVEDQKSMWQIVNIAVNLCRIINKLPTDVPTVVRFGVQTECAKVLQIVCNTVEIPVAFARRAGSLAA